MPSPLQPTDLRCEYLPTPLGVDPETPIHLSWRFEVPDEPSESARQTAFRILAATSPDLLTPDGADLWDSGPVASERNVGIPWRGPPVPSARRVYWTVQVRDRDGVESAFAEPTWFETGLAAADWAPARWIRPDCRNWPRPLPAVYLRREFRIDERVVRARAYVCGLGCHELYLNGMRVGDRVLEPAQTDYETCALYSVYDITHALGPGENAAGVILGNGWYNQDRVWTGAIDPVYGLPGLIAKLLVELESGETVSLVSDESWEAGEGPVRENNIYSGENYDARKETPGWSAAGFTGASTWRPVVPCDPLAPRLDPQLMPPVRPTETRPPVSKSEVCPGVWVFDLGRNLAGWARIRVRGNSGQEIRLRFAETIFPDGTLDPASTGPVHTGVVQTDRYICRGGNEPETWEPRFTYHGFQYVEVTGLEGEPADDILEGVAVHTDLPAAGRFRCSDELLNRIHRTAVHTLASNLHGLPTDCPVRERCGWLGDAHVMAEYTLYNYDSVPFWRKYLRDIENGLGEGGETYLGAPADPRAPPNIVPGRRRCEQARPDWGVACVLIPWLLYLHAGDRVTLARHYPMMRGWTEYLAEISRDGIVEEGFGDWCPPGGNTEIECPVALSSTAYFYFNLEAMASIAAVVGETGDSERYRERAVQVRETFIRTFYDAEKKTFGSQTANALALFLGLFPADDRAALAAGLVREVTERHGGHFFTGIHGMNHLFRELTNNGHDDVAMGAIRAEGFPGFQHHFSLGGTTLWEIFFDPHVHELNQRSRNHPMHGSFDAWFYSGVAGIRPDPAGPGFTRVAMRPALVRHLQWAEGIHECVQGTIRSAWRRNEGGFEWEIELPGNTAARVWLPHGCRGNLWINGKWKTCAAAEGPPYAGSGTGMELPPGRHTVRVEPDSFNKY